ncbi:hypothetical protein C8J57DRAFT_1520558 [Mycena rebaudengoi]|nr:hypothetical protein C8J57DRAFT_1520558 [Mycena rebaudengoi]
MADPVTPLAPAAPGAPVNPPPVVVTDSQKIDNLNAQIALLLAVPDARQLAREAAAELYRTLQTSQAVAQAAAPVQLLPPMPPVEQQPPPFELPAFSPQFNPPLAPLHSPAAVITHDLKASDLYKLDTRVKDSEPTYSLSASGTLEMNNSRQKPIKISILSPSPSTITLPSSQFISPTTPRYEWAAVFEYHTLFFNRRWGDMAAGQYEQWAPQTSRFSARTSSPTAKPSTSQAPPRLRPNGLNPRAPSLAGTITLASAIHRATSDVCTPVRLLAAARSTR